MIVGGPLFADCSLHIGHSPLCKYALYSMFPAGLIASVASYVPVPWGIIEQGSSVWQFLEKVIKVMLMGLVLVSGLSACDLMSHSHCDNKTVNEVKSPDGRYVAILYHRSCVNGALYTWVSVQENSLLFGETEPVLELEGIHEISGVWKDSNHLEISSVGFQNQKTVLSQETSWKTVSISYKE